jgi:hypothetical protein
MSSGSFVLAKYETNAGAVRPIRVQPETIIAAVNPEATGTSQGDRIRVSGGKRKIGRKARSVSLVQNVGAAVDGYQPTKSIRIPIFTLDAYNALTEGQTITYNGSAWKVSGVTNESGK